MTRLLARRPRTRLVLLTAAAAGSITMLAGAGILALVTAHVTSTVLGATVTVDRSAIPAILEDLRQTDLSGLTKLSDEAASQLDSRARAAGIESMTIVGPGGTVFSTAASGMEVADPSALAAALRGEARAAVLATESPGGRLIVEHLPIQIDATTVGAVEVQRDGGELEGYLGSARRDVALATLSGTFAAVFLVWLIFRAAQTRLDRQSALLTERARRDPLTGLRIMEPRSRC